MRQAKLRQSQVGSASDADVESNSNDSADLRTYNGYESEADPSQRHYPLSEMQCSAKISCCSFNYHCKHLLASSDYEGTVQLWDVNSATALRQYTEHTTRSWTVHFHAGQPRCLASGADDGTIKLWDTNSQHSVCTLNARVNVCCVHFNPVRQDLLAAGLSNHATHVYDIRAPSKPVKVLTGHAKAVSYVRFLSDGDHLISASTDSSLRLWQLGRDLVGDDQGDQADGVVKRVFTGHVNEKNFVGLSVEGDMVVCGSESNSVHVYNTGVRSPLLRYDLTALRRPHPAPVNTPNAHSPFVSAVTWKKGSRVIVAANSVGNAEIIQLY